MARRDPAMPHATAATQHTLPETCRHVGALLAAATSFMAPDRGEALIRKWLGRRDLAGMSEDRLVAMSADAVLLAADLLLSYPAASGTTALDRLARSCAGATGAEAAALAALCQSRFRLLQLEADHVDPEPGVRDLLSGESLRIVGADWPKLPNGTALFGRVVMLEAGWCCLPGAITPLDATAFALARGHVAAGSASPAAGARWAEA